MVKLIKKNYFLFENKSKIESLSLKQIIEKRNKILIFRKYGGLGDIVCSSMLFRNIKHQFPQLHVTYAFPKQYHDVMSGHKFIDKMIACEDVNLNDYGYSCDISKDCGRYESSMAPFVDKHRGDIWGELSLDITLDFHEFDIPKDEILINVLKGKYFKEKDKPKIALINKSSSTSKDLTNDKTIEFMNICQENDLKISIIEEKKTLLETNYHQIIRDLSIKSFVNLISAFDYVITVDTGSFHVANAFQIPTIGIFPWTDGFVLSKYHNKCIVFQPMHRNLMKENKTCPCWNWISCPYRKRGNDFPLKCMDINPLDVFNSLQELMRNFKSEN